MEDFFIFMEKYQGEDLHTLSENQWQQFTTGLEPNKPLQKVWQIAELIQRIAPDVLLLCEVGGKISLENFNRYFLNDSYNIHLIEGNSKRGIDIGYMTKKSLAYQFELKSHRERTLDFHYPAGASSDPNEILKFSRDVLELRLLENTQTKLIFFLVHLKSKLDIDNIDFEGRGRREAELKKVIDIYLEVQKETKNKVPIILAGDFNGQAGVLDQEPEFKNLYQRTQLQDILELTNKTPEQRTTLFHFANPGRRLSLQLDYIFLPPELHRKIDPKQTFVHYYQNEAGENLPLPESREERTKLPSDHYPLVTTLSLDQ